MMPKNAATLKHNGHIAASSVRGRDKANFVAAVEIDVSRTGPIGGRDNPVLHAATHGVGDPGAQSGEPESTTAARIART